MNEIVNIGVLGCGVFGGYHTGKCVAHPLVNFVGVFDKNPTRAKDLASKFQTQAYRSAASLFSRCDAVIIATPGFTHGDYAVSALNHGCHALIEKPISHTVEEAEHIIALAHKNNLITQIGHQERFVVAATGLHRVTSKPLKIEAIRFSPYSQRGTDVSVTLDLMTHDIDLVLWLMDATPNSIKGATQRVRSDHSDASLAHLTFGQTRVRLQASRVEAASQRRMRLEYPEGEVEIDFNAKTLTHTTPFELNENFGEAAEAQDSLGAATNAFVSAILHGTDVSVSGEDGLAALRIAKAIERDDA